MTKETSQILLQTLWHLRKPQINLVSLWGDSFTDNNIGQVETLLGCINRYRVFWTARFIMYLSNRSFNIPPRQPPGHFKFWKIFVQNSKVSNVVTKETSQILLQTLWHLRKPQINLVSLWGDSFTDNNIGQVETLLGCINRYRVFWTAQFIMYQSNQSFNIHSGQPPGHLNFWKVFQCSNSPLPRPKSCSNAPS